MSTPLEAVRDRYPAWTGVRDLARDPRRLRVALHDLAVVVVLASFLTSEIYEGETYSRLMAPPVLLLMLLAWRVRRAAFLLFALAAGASASITPDAVFLWPAVAGLVALSTADDLADLPWLGWVAGYLGAGAGAWYYRFETGSSGYAAFLAVVLGTALGFLLRSLTRSAELTRENRSWRDRTLASQRQTQWLEQRTALARELHDIVGHHVTAMVVQAEAGLVGDPAAALERIGDLGRAALGELDALVVHLRDPDSPLGVTAPPRLSDIDELLAAPLRQQGVEVVVHLDPEPGLDEHGVLACYRIAQEALTNVARHAGARHAWVELRRTPGQVRLRVSDDGSGPPAERGRGAGLTGIEERVLALGGRWDLSARPGGGTMLDVLVPVRP